MQCFAVLLVGVLVTAASSSVNYCGSRMCANTNAHTFCQFPEGPSPSCVGYISAHLTIEEKSRLIARLNRRRNEAAAGNMRGLPSAGNMLKLRWVEELAREAQRWADQCRPPQPLEEHDACRDLYSLTVGQCVASVVGEAPGLRVESMVDIWYMQSLLYKGNVTFYMPPRRNSSFYGDFAQIIWARSYMIGCGRSRFMTPWQGRLRSVERLVCNIAPSGPPAMRPLWAPAAPAASCPPRSIRHTVLTSLCDYQWNYNEIMYIDSSMSLEEHLLLNTVLEIENNDTLNYLGSLDEIYLTKVAIATMENTISTQVYYNSMQRRDVVEVIEMAEAKVTTSTPVTQVKVIPTTNNTTPSDIKTNPIKVIKTTRKKISFVGRPKTYNMEDLTDFNDKTENETPNEDIPKKEKEFYAEYEFVETVDENSTTSIDYKNATQAPSKPNVLLNQDATTTEDMTVLYQNISVLYEAVNKLVDNNSINTDVSSPSDGTPGIWNTTQDIIGNVTFLVNDNIDEYLSDPETVRELQEALDRIEHDMAPKPSTERQAKVRRELRNFPEEPETTTKMDPQISEALYNAEVERNKSIERGPMYNMVLKYMPYLKQYEGSKSDDSSSGASCISPSFVLVFSNLFVIV